MVSQAPAQIRATSMPALASVPWAMAYNYTSEHCGSYGCRKCWNDITAAAQASHSYRVPATDENRRDEYIWVTPNFFRFQEEAQAFLALPPHNKAERGLYLDTTPTESGALPWRMCAASQFQGRPGGALEYQLPINVSPWTPVPIYESFTTIPLGSSCQAGNGNVDFKFERL